MAEQKYDLKYEKCALKLRSNQTGVINDPLGQPTVPAGSDNCFCTCPSPLFFKSSKAKQQKTTVSTGETVGLDEWIIDAPVL